MLIVIVAALTPILHEKVLTSTKIESARFMLGYICAYVLMDLFTTLLNVCPILIVRLRPLRSWKSK